MYLYYVINISLIYLIKVFQYILIYFNIYLKDNLTIFVCFLNIVLTYL